MSRTLCMLCMMYVFVHERKCKTEGTVLLGALHSGRDNHGTPGLHTMKCRFLWNREPRGAPQACHRRNTVPLLRTCNARPSPHHSPRPTPGFQPPRSPPHPRAAATLLPAPPSVAPAAPFPPSDPPPLAWCPQRCPRPLSALLDLLLFLPISRGFLGFLQWTKEGSGARQEGNRNPVQTANRRLGHQRWLSKG